jgi:hypothetical protein
MPYKYKSILKSFEYSKNSYKIISDFLLSGDIINPDVKLKVDNVTKAFKAPTIQPRDWFRLSTTKAYISALINIRLEAKDSKLEKIIRKWIKDENITLDILFAEWRKNPIGKNLDLFDIIALDQNTNQKKSSEEKLVLNLELFEKLDDNKLMKLLKDIDMVDVKKGGDNKNGQALQGTWINRDLTIKYAEWLDPRFSIWVSKKIQELIMDGVAWNEIIYRLRMQSKNILFQNIRKCLNIKFIQQLVIFQIREFAIKKLEKFVPRKILKKTN